MSRSVSRAASAALALSLCAAAISSLPATPASAAAPSTPSPATIHTGASTADAAPSCWAIKQSFPASADGVYWLQTPTLIAPQQFYCDMTTQGGGWVMVGRGREGWTFNWRGQSNVTSLRTTVAGTGAFAPAALPTTTIDGLLDGGRVDALADGVRIRRATNSSGTNYQEMRFNYLNLDGWSWDLYGGIPLKSISFDGATTNFSSYSRCSTATTCEVNLDNGLRRVGTKLTSSHNNKQGFAYGDNISGSNSSSSYLWTYTNERSALPFAQVFLRPMLGDANVDFATITNAGTAVQALRPLPVSTPQIMQWGVTDVSKPATDPDPKNDSPVLALAQVGNTMFVGGKFQNVQHGAGGAKTSQPWLAAFDVETGAWINTFRPSLDGAVWDLRASPDGKLFVAGNFTSINGAPNTAGLAKIDPATGNPVSGWTAFVSSPRYNTPRAHARALDIQGNWLYLGGSFNTVTGGPSLTSRSTGGVARVSLTDGTPDATWKGYYDNTVMDISASPDGTRVYVVGFFKNMGTTSAFGTPRDAVAVVDAVSGAAIPGMKQYVPSAADPTRHYQQTIMEYQGSVFLGGSEHDFQKYTRSDLSLVRGNVTEHGGDFQAVAAKDGVVYGSCHCYQGTYADTYSWPPTSNYGRVDNSLWTNAYDATTFDKIPDFDPQWGVNTGTGEGIWELTFDSDGCLWAGGDLIRGGYSGSTPNWLGGFARFCQRDVTPPTSPTNLRTTVSGATTNLQWAASTENTGGAIKYEILRDDRVVAVQGARTFALPDTNYGRWFVRAIDATGNRSASTEVLTVGTKPTYPQLVASTPQVRGHWRLGESATNQAAANAVGADTGTYSGNVTVGAPGVITDATNTAATFAGSDGVVTIPSSATLSPTTATSLEAWVDVADTAGARDIVGKLGTMALRMNGAFSFSVSTGNGTFTATAPSSVTTGRHHLVGTYDGASVRLYDSGALVASALATGTLVNSASPLLIGNGASGAFAGAIDEVALYGRALILKEILSHYNTGGPVILANSPPTAQFQATCGSLTCGLDATQSSDADGSIVSYEWSINDGGSATGASTVYSFATAGTYQVTLTVTDDAGATASTSQTLVAAPVPPAAYASDSFNRTLNGSWGIADDSSSWVTPGSSATYSVDGDTGRYTLAGAGASSSSRLPTVVETDLDVQTRFQFNVAQNNGSWINLVGRFVANGLEYRGRVRIGASTLSAAAYRVSGGATTQVGSQVTVPGVTAAPNTWYRVRFNVSGTNPTRLKLKVWLDGTAEPAAWNVDVTDNTAALQTAGSPGLQAFANGSASYPLVYRFDDFTAGPANTAPVASFTTDCSQALGCNVDGSASSDADGSVVNYTWNFGDGTNGVGSTTSHTYSTPGTYVITLMVTDDGGLQHSTSHSVVIASAFTAAFTSNCTNYACSFDGSASSVPSGTITGYAWNFGDATSASGVTPSHTYLAPGVYPVTLTVTASGGGTASASHNVTADLAPVASFTVSCTLTSCSVNGSGSSDPDGSVSTYLWDFGNGTTASGATATASYALAGSWPIQLTVTDDLGRTNTSTQIATASIALPLVTTYASDTFTRSQTNAWGTAGLGGSWTVAGASPSLFGVNGTAATFTLPAAGATAAARLDGVSQADVDIQTTVALNATTTGAGSWINVLGRSINATTEYRARIRFSSTSVYAAAYRLPGGAAQLIAPEANTGIASLPNTDYRVRFNVSGANPTTLRIKVWNASDPEPAAWNVVTTDSTPALQVAGTVGVQSYARLSSAYPLVFAVDDFTVRQAVLPPVASFTTGCASTTCSVNASGSFADAPITTYEWVYGDGTTDTGITANHTFAVAGAYTITLTVTDSLGTSTVTTRTVNVS